MKKIGFLGPLGTFSDEATEKYSKEAQIQIEKIPFETVSLVFDAVRAGNIDEGLVPVENLLHGNISETLDCLYNNGVKIKQAIILPIEQYLVCLQDTKAEDIKEIRSHVQALAQCSKYLDINFKGVSRIVTKSTASAMDDLVKGNLENSAAIGSLNGAKINNLKILTDNIANNIKNKTMFLVIYKASSDGIMARRSEKNRTSIAIIPPADRPGLLRDILNVFAIKNINLEMIQSRPDGNGNYIFYMDLVGHVEDENIKEAFEHISKIFGRDIKEMIKLFGSYPYVTLSS